VSGELTRASLARTRAAVNAARAFHEKATTFGAGLRGGRFDYCATCSGHPAWPCPEVAAIRAALKPERSQR